MRIASYNVENMFRRPVALNAGHLGSGPADPRGLRASCRPLGAASYSAADQARIVALLTTLGLLKSDESRWVILRRTRGQLVTPQP